MDDQDLAVLGLERVWRAATRGKLHDIDALLARCSAEQRLSDPLALALRAVKNVLTADVRGGIALLRRAIERCDGATRQYLIELLVPFLVSVGEVARADDLLDAVGEPLPELAPAYLAARAVLAAQQGYAARSRRYADEALAIVRDAEDPMVVARTLQRVGLAAFYVEDYDRAQERSLEAARAYERIGALRAACNAYSVLYAIAVAWLGDPVVARSYAARIATIAESDGDASMQNLGLVAQLEIAADAGDETRYESARARLLANPLHEQYRERFSFVVAEILTNVWQARFEPARSATVALRSRGSLSATETMMCDALLALLDVARWQVDEAKERAHAVLSRTATRPGREPLFEAQRRRRARILAAAVCIVIGETTRGRRALSKAFDPDGAFARLDPVDGLDEESVEPMLRGYARAIGTVCRASAQRKPRLGLTNAEMEILRALPSGDSVADIASALHKSKRTVERQLGSIYEKMDVSTRAQAVAKARTLGLHA